MHTKCLLINIFVMQLKFQLFYATEENKLNDAHCTLNVNFSNVFSFPVVFLFVPFTSFILSLFFNWKQRYSSLLEQKRSSFVLDSIFLHFYKNDFLMFDSIETRCEWRTHTLEKCNETFADITEIISMKFIYKIWQICLVRC